MYTDSYFIVFFLFQALQNVKAPLATHYGAIAGLSEMGSEVKKRVNNLDTAVPPKVCLKRRLHQLNAC